MNRIITVIAKNLLNISARHSVIFTLSAVKFTYFDILFIKL